MNMQTQIKQDENFLCGLELPEYKLNIYTVYTGSQKVMYHAFLDGKRLFQGNDYRPSPLRDIDSLESLVDLLGFLTCQPGDTDDEYFANYTEDQSSWATSFECEQLKGLVNDFDNDAEKEFQKKARKYFKKHFIR